VPHPTFFELTLALALDWMERRGAHWVVLEAGMGGRLDATNVVTPAVSVITPVAMDHEQWLGNSLAEIAAEKAGIIKPGVPAVSARQHPDAERVLRDAARAAGTEIRFVTEPWPGRLPLPGTHQQWNAALALAALEAAGLRPPPEVVQQGLADTIWPGRFQIMEGGRLVVDGAHNPHGTAATAQTWREVFPGQKATLIYGAVAAKDYQASLQCLAGVAARCFTVTLQSPRALPAALLAAAVPPGTMQTKAWDSLETALAAARTLPERILICGSLYLCGETLALLTGKTHELSAQ
jgi:dihydrofolate synthase/folylpolyglutamate synthase